MPRSVLRALLPGQDPQVLIYLLALVVILWLLRQSRRWLWLFSLLAFPGTLCHEGCHWLVGRLLNGQPVSFTVLPRREGRRVVLGTVQCAHMRWYNAFFVGMAPLLLLLPALLVLRWRLLRHPALDWREALLLFVIANLIQGAVPSGQDLRVAARSPIGWLLLGAGLLWGWARWTGRL
nr:hypothetical protein [uncultured Holophaga sp.]